MRKERTREKIKELFDLYAKIDDVLYELDMLERESEADEEKNSTTAYGCRSSDHSDSL